MAAHRYWRVLFATATSAYEPLNFIVGVSEIEMRLTIGGADVATGGTAFGTGFNTPSNAFDDNTGTSATNQSGTFQRILGYDFGAGNDQDIAEIAVRVASNASYWVYTQWSDDNTNWTTAGIAANIALVSTGLTVVFPGTILGPQVSKHYAYGIYSETDLKVAKHYSYAIYEDNTSQIFRAGLEVIEVTGYPIAPPSSNRRPIVVVCL